MNALLTIKQPYETQQGITPQLAQGFYRDSRKAGVINLTIDPLLRSDAYRAIGRAVETFPKQMEDYLKGFRFGSKDRLLINEVAIAIKFMEPLKPVTTKAQSAVNVSVGRHTLEKWITINVPDTQTGLPHDSGYYMGGEQLLIAACHDFPNATERYVSWAKCPSDRKIGYRANGLKAAYNRLTPLHLQRVQHPALSRYSR